MNKRIKGIRRILCLILTWAMLGNSLGVSQVQAQESLGEMTAATEEGTGSTWDGVTREKRWELERCLVVYTLNDCWDSGYTAMVTVENTSDTTIENWHVAFPMEGEIKDLWNAQIVEGEQSGAVFKNVGWNQDIAIGQSIQFGFTVEGEFKGFPEICEMPAVLQSVSGSDVEVTYEVTDSWENGFRGNIHIANTSGRTIEDWQLSFDLPYEINDLWEGRIVSHENNNYVVKNNTYNQNIAPDGTITIGFAVWNGSAEIVPANYMLEEVTLGEYTGTGSGDDKPAEDVPSGDVSGDVSSGDVSGGDLEEVTLTIDTTPFDLNEAWELYLTDEKLSGLFGTLTGVKQVKKLTFTVTDINETVVDSGEIPVCANWEITPFGLALGTNCITITAHLADDRTVEEEIYLMNFNEENMEAADLDLSDSDGDGINNYFETVFGTDMLSEDTDGDGLKDFDEITKTGTDPGLTDSDGNGVGDGEEDFDEDGLTNLEEMAAGAGPLYPDTDGDGLKDGEEVKTYATAPVDEDSDEDGLRDGEDVRLGYDPNNPDTDGDGILDGDEIAYQTYTEVLDQGRKAGITQVSVSMDCVGCIDNEVNIHNVYNLDMRTTNVVGLFGAPVDIESRTEFDKATITFTYDEAALGETSEDNLRIMWYDKENDKYIILDDETVLDTENNTLSYTTDHFSTWMVVDRVKWWNAWKVDLGYTLLPKLHTCNYNISYVYDYMPVANLYCEDPYLVFNGSIRIEIDSNDIDSWGANCGHGFYGGTATLESAINKAVNISLQKPNDVVGRAVCIVSKEDIPYNQQLVQTARTYGIQLYTVTENGKAAPNISRMVLETGGRHLVTDRWDSSGVSGAMVDEKYKECRSHYVEESDTDGDGLLDIYEQCGMRISNATIVKTKSGETDSDRDGINDFLDMGGVPTEETYTVDGETFTSVVNRGALCNELPKDFIYVDGRENANGETYDGKMNHVTHSKSFEDKKYNESFKPNLFDGTQWAGGEAKVHGIYSYMFAEKSDKEAELMAMKYSSFNTILVIAIANLAHDPYASYTFYNYIMGCGGPYEGCRSEGTRDYIPIRYMLDKNFDGRNSARNCFDDNMRTAQTVAESVLNGYNQEIYIALSPDAEPVWSGCNYVEYGELVIDDVLDVACNVSAFGIFNSAEASVTLHCTYDPTTQTYEAEYIYYIVDFYDYSKLWILYEEDALGLARSYELFGKCEGKTEWKKGETANWLWGNLS